MNKNTAAVELAKLAKGKPKTLSRTQRENARKRMAKARAHRWKWKAPDIEMGVP